MHIIQWPHPTLLYRSKPLKRVDAELRAMIDQMFDLMYTHKGVGLAANQVDLPYRMFVVNPTGDRAEKQNEQVFINPVLSRPRGSVEDEEGCLSLPGLYAPVRRPERVHVNAFTLKGEELDFEAEGHFARILQHENDHLDGVMFIDRLETTAQMDLREDVEAFLSEYEQRRSRGELPSDDEIAERLKSLEAART